MYIPYLIPISNKIKIKNLHHVFANDSKYLGKYLGKKFIQPVILLIICKPVIFNMFT